MDYQLCRSMNVHDAALWMARPISQDASGTTLFADLGKQKVPCGVVLEDRLCAGVFFSGLAHY